MFIALLFITAKILNPPNQAKCPSTDGYRKFSSAIIDNTIFSFVTTRMNLKNIMLREISQTKKDEY